MADQEFWSKDRRFGLRINEERVTELLGICRRSSPYETGGILLGHYSTTYDCAYVTAVTKAPGDSKSGRTWFIRGVRGLQNKIDQFWHRKQGYYLGEWHFHPFGSPRPSPTDRVQMEEISQSDLYHCPEPVLLIIGGDPRTSWSVGAYVFVGDQDYIEMKAQARGVSTRSVS